MLTKANEGQGAARNLGLEHATGTWVTFTDPDDMLDADFFRVADGFAASHPDVEVMAAKPLILEDGSGRTKDAHPRRRQFEPGNRLVDLDVEPDSFGGSATVSLFRLDRLRSLDLHDDTRIRPNFEDGLFAVCYVLALERPVVGLLRDAKYVYRKRAAGDSALQRSLGDPGRYTDVLRFGYLDVIARSRARLGVVPPWVQHVLILELPWYLSADERFDSDVRLADELIPVFHDLFGQIVRQLDQGVIKAHSTRPLKPVWIDLLAHGWRPDPWHAPEAMRTKVDARTGLQRICYRYTGTPPDEEILVDGSHVKPAYGKRMSHTYYGRAVIHERIAWLPAGGALVVRLDGKPHPVVDGSPPAWARPAKARPAGPARPPVGGIRGVVRRVARLARGRAASAVLGAQRLAARMPPYRPAFRDAWVLMDRVHNADDNGERLFEHLRDAPSAKTASW